MSAFQWRIAALTPEFVGVASLLHPRSSPFSSLLCMEDTSTSSLLSMAWNHSIAASLGSDIDERKEEFSQTGGGVAPLKPTTNFEELSNVEPQ